MTMDLITHPTANEWPPYMLVSDGKPQRMTFQFEGGKPTTIWPIFDDPDAAADVADELAEHGPPAEPVFIDGHNGMSIAEHVAQAKADGCRMAVVFGEVGCRVARFDLVA